MSEWTPYQTDHLFLLVGTNPLPNYVAALLLAKDDSTIHLLHSGGTRGTEGVATKLKESIQRRRPQIKELVLREIDDADGGRIAQKMTGVLQSIDKRALVGLHYTGGTKAMTVHVYQAVREQFQTAIFSYLDARTLSLKIDRPGEAQSKSIRVERACSVKLDDLMVLHGREIGSKEQETDLQQLQLNLVKLHTTNPEAWREWCDKHLRRQDRKDKKIKTSKTDLRAVELPNDDSVVASVFASHESWQTLGDALPQGWEIVKFAEWLDGKWLDHYTFDCVRQVATSCGLHDYGLSLKSQGVEFEFDVAATRGYQLFALSCTTGSEKGMSKLKLFEAYIRARQIGGDEARVALVCCYHDPSVLQKEIEESWFPEGRVHVFGRENLPDLAVRLKEWFETANPTQ